MNRLVMPRLTLICLAALIALSGCSAGPATPQQDPPLAGAAIGGEFELVDKTGKTVRWSDFGGRYRIVYFGYTFCPDVCPNDVGKIVRGLALFAKDHPREAGAIQPIFITIDPARDTPEKVGEFAAAFSDDLLGLTGTEAQVKAAADVFGIYYARGETHNGYYLMDHSAYSYLFGPKGEPITTLPTEVGPEAVATELAKWVH